MDELLKELKNKNEQFSEEYIAMMKQYYNKLQNSQINPQVESDKPDTEGGVIIMPNQFCCVKVSDVNGQKVFLNITHHEKIDAPIEQHILEMQNQLGVRLPLSLSEKFEDFDNKNQICQVYDVIFNSGVVKKAEEDNLVLQFMVQLVIERIKQKFNHELKSNFVKMKNLKYKGKFVRPQRVRVKKGPKIEEILENNNKFDSNSNNPLLAKEINKAVNEKGKTPLWNFIILKCKEFTINHLKILSNEKILVNLLTRNRFSLNYSTLNNNNTNFFNYYDGSNAYPKYGNSLLFVMELNLLSKSTGINLNICDEGMVLNVSKIYSIEINFPFRIYSKEAYSMFDKDNRLLYIYLPFYEVDCIEFQREIQSNKSENINISEEYVYDLVC